MKEQYTYAVVCYAIHNKAVASIDIFASLQEAQEFLSSDAKNTAMEEALNSNDNVELTLDDERAILSSCKGEYEWTWEIQYIRNSPEKAEKNDRKKNAVNAVPVECERWESVYYDEASGEFVYDCPACGKPNSYMLDCCPACGSKVDEEKRDGEGR